MTKADGAGLTERLRITEAGLVGIGTSSPGALLEANGGDIRMVNTNGRIYLSNGNTSGGAKIGVRGTSGTANGYLAFETNDIEFARFDSSGRLGIGTTSPGDLLTLNSTVGYPLATFNDSGTFRGQIGYTFDYGYFHVTSASTLGFRANGSERARIDSSGRVGIGTTVANSKLSIGLGSSTNDGLTLTFTGDNSTVARFFADTATGQVSIGGIGASYFPVFYAGAAEKARIDTSGRLLVGTSSARSNFFNGVASAALQLEGTGTNRRAAIIGDDFEASLILASQKSGAVGGNTVLASGDPVGAVSFQGNDGSEFVEAATITAFVDGTPGANDMPGRLVFSTTADGAATPTERLRIDSSGRLLVGTSTTGLQNTRSMLWQGSGEAALYINHSTSDGSGDPFIKFGYNGGEIGSITQSGTTAVAYNTSSDYRLKENVTPVTDGITRLQQLNPSRFNFIADPAKTVDGFIAHEVQVVVPEAITGEKDAEDDDGNPIYQGIDQSKLVPLLTAALQEAIAKIESLEARLTAAGI